MEWTKKRKQYFKKIAFWSLGLVLISLGLVSFIALFAGAKEGDFPSLLEFLISVLVVFSSLFVLALPFFIYNLKKQ